MKKVAVGIDIGGTNTVLGLVDKEGNIFGEDTVHTKDFPDFDQYLEELYVHITALLDAGNEQFELIGIGIGAPNANYYTGEIVNAPNLLWGGVIPFVKKLQHYFPNIPIKLTNDANAAAIGEMVFGGARGMRDFIVVTLGTGLGSGFVCNGE
ncbi:MAG: ROK family protein, partial [Rikenellaceae bacterium]